MSRFFSLISMVFFMSACSSFKLPEDKVETPNSATQTCKEEEKPSDDCNECSCTDGQWMCTLRACAAAEPCDWLVMESYPEQISGTCKYDQISEEYLTIELPEYRPGDDPIRTLLIQGDQKSQEISGAIYDPESQQLSIPKTALPDGHVEINIRYTASTQER